MFYGKECPHCHKMMPLVEKLEKEGVLFETLIQSELYELAPTQAKHQRVIVEKEA